MPAFREARRLPGWARILCLAAAAALGGDERHPGTQIAVPVPSAMPVAVADVNADGRPDALMGTATGIVLMPGNDGAVLEPGRQILAGRAVFNLAVDDFDRDGIPDIAAYCPLGAAVLILKGLGNGEFRQVSSIAVSYYESRGLVSADFDQDGIADLAAAQSNSIAIFHGNGDGTFQPAAEVPAKMRTWAVAAADFNGDGRPDLAIVNGQTLSIALGSGGGTFQAPVEVPLSACGPSEIALSDLNRDGKTDIAAACGTGLASLLGNGDGTFRMGEMKRYGDEPLSIATGDIDGDGLPDAIVGNYYNGRISVFRGQGDGTFAELDSVPALGDVYGVAVADFNSDGKADIVASSYSSSSGLIALGRGDGQFEAPAIFGASYALTGSFLRSVDLDADGQMELAAFIPLRKSAALLRQGLTPMGSAGFSGYPMDAQAGDFNGDGKADLVAVTLGSVGVRNNNDARAAIVLVPGLGNGTFGGGVEVAGMAYPLGGAVTAPLLATGDFNGDAMPDLVFANGAAKSLQVFRGTGGGGFEQVAEISGAGAEAMASADFNGDGVDDLAVASGGIRIYPGARGGLFGDPRMYPSCGPGRTVLRGDFNGDSKPDLALLCGTGITILMNTGGGSFQELPTQPAGSDATPVLAMTVGDFDEDGKDDLALAQRLNDVWGGGSILLSNGDGTFRVGAGLSLPSSPMALAAGRWSGSGAPQLAVLSALEGTVTLVLPVITGSR